MIIELIATRILAPYIGVSLYTLTSIIGTILLSIALGNFIGGKIADKYAPRPALVIILLIGALSTACILPITRIVTTTDWFENLSSILNFTLRSGSIFFFPAFVLSMVSPLVIKMLLIDTAHTGHVVGTIYAVSTAGALLGTFMTGFYFILWFGLTMIVYLVSGIVLITALFIWIGWKMPDYPESSAKNIAVWFIIILVGCCVVLLFQFRERWQVSYTKESNYYSIQVTSMGQKIKVLQLDQLMHTFIIPDEPTNLQYAYVKVFAEIVGYVNNSNRSLNVLHLGGGGYSFPRYLEAVYPGSTNEVVEIDPAVTEVAHEELGLPWDTTIKTYYLDARQFLMQKSDDNRYDLIVGDVFNGLSTPYHLTTYEFDRLVQKNLKPDGMYMMNIVDNYLRGRYMASMLWTLQHVFHNVYLFSTEISWNYPGLETYIIVATDNNLDIEGFKEYMAVKKSFVANVHDPVLLTEYIAQKNAILLTDDYAPTDILLASIMYR